MNVKVTFVFLFTLLLGLFGAPTAWSATPAEIAQQTRSQWAKAKETYLAAVKPYQGRPEHATLIKAYGDTLDSTGQILEQYLALKLASPPAPAAKITPVVDQLAKNLAQLRSLRGQAKGDLVTVLGTVLTEHNQITQTALKNMR